MSAVAGLRESEDVPPCEEHGSDALVTTCRACRASWAYREALRSARHWQERYREARAKCVDLERRRNGR